MDDPRNRRKWQWSLAIALFLAIVSAANTTPGAAQPDAVQRHDFQIAQGRLTDNRKTITVKRGDRVEITWRTDTPTTLHLHGYDIEASPGPDKPQTMSFTARATGRFAIETHTAPGHGKSGHHMVLIYLEVHPR
jgi:FtsP/CotA-like multicopper oxidase with cupredoxin domain